MMQPVPLRPDEQVAGGFLYVTLGGQSYELRVLPMAASRKWKQSLADAIRGVVTDVAPSEHVGDVADLLADQAEVMMDLIIAYDTEGTLPEREWIDSHATDRECYESLKRVTAATYPFAPEVLRIVPDLLPLLADSLSRGVATAMVAISSLRSTSSAPPNTDGPRPTSTPTSPTSSSRSTSKKPPSASSKPRSRN